jgi:3',5'-cyclic AMP phosphodiesterase CpdA
MFLAKMNITCRMLLVFTIINVFLLSSCSDNDMLGLFYSTGIQERFPSKDIFHYLDNSDLQIDLNENYSFLVLSDVHISDKGVNGLEQIAEKAAENGDSFIVITGDLTQSGTQKEMDMFIQTAKSFPIPCYPVIGNHDIFFGNWKVWKKMIGTSIYRVDANDTTLFMLDSANASFGNDQLDWLESQLKTAGKNTFVFTHTNLFTNSGGEFQQFADYRERARFMSLLNGKCTALFSGHSHEYVNLQIGGVRYITLDGLLSSGTYCCVKVSSGTVSYEIKYL